MAKERVIAELSDEEAKLSLTPMIDMAFLILIFFMCLPFKTLEGKLAAFLPTDKGINPIPQEPPNEIKVSVHIVARQEIADRWGPEEKPISRPTVFKYKFGDRETDQLADVSQWIKDAYKAAEGTENTKVLGEIKAGHKVPHKFVVAVLNKFAEAGMEKVDFYGTAIPGQELRERPYLPYPLKNYVTSD
ncbi:MAG: ExbD/TolR family protein [Planctomycetota bacterium]|jgi:biopolymer transport protein ExbD